LLYNPQTGDAEILVFKNDLSVATEKTFSWASSQVLYVGHFGMPTLSIMLYDPQAVQSTFIAVDGSLTVSHQVTVASWDNRWQIIIGAFLDRSRCIAANNCTAGDDILALNRQTGQIEQFVFSFANQYQVVDNRSQGYVRNGVATTETVTAIDTSAIDLLATLHTGVGSEELY
jgi:hypothetical protein